MSNSHRRRLRITEDIIQVARYRSNVGWRWVVHAAGGKEGKEDDEEEEEEKEEEEKEEDKEEEGGEGGEEGATGAALKDRRIGNVSAAL